MSQDTNEIKENPFTRLLDNGFIRYIQQSIQRLFADPQAVVLSVTILIVALAIWLMAKTLPPVLVSIAIAYLFEGLLQRLNRFRVPRLAGVSLLVGLLVAAIVAIAFILLPLLTAQLMQVVKGLPALLSQWQDAAIHLPDKYPGFFEYDEIMALLDKLRTHVTELGQTTLTFVLQSIPGVVTIVVYLILVPLLIFFMLKDKQRILGWFKRFIPDNYALTSKVWQEIDIQIANYVRGKFIEMLILGVATYITYAIMGLNYAVWIAVISGLSVLIPYVGAVVALFPVLIVGLLQWGWAPDTLSAVVAYGVLQAIDGNLLAPLLFSEVVKLHPIAIIIAVIFFGSIWGFWGVFFAIPLATIVKAVITAWPSKKDLNTP